MTTVRTNVHSYKAFKILNLMWNRASNFLNEARVVRATPEMAELLHIAPWPAVMRIMYLDDMTVAIEYGLQPDRVLPPSVVKGAAAAVIITTAMIEYEHENLWYTTHKKWHMDLADLIAVAHESISPWNQSVLIDDILLAASLIADANVSGWPSGKVRAFAGRELNPIEFEFAAHISDCLADIDKKKKQQIDKLNAAHDKAIAELNKRARTEKDELREKAASLLGDNLVDASVHDMVSTMVANHLHSIYLDDDV